MNLELWLAFVAACLVMVAAPGPTVALIVGYALAHGRRTALATTVGASLGMIVSMTLSLIGLGALLAASATLFTLAKLFGAAYLVYLGVKLWRSPTGMGEQAPDVPRSPRAMLLHAFLVEALNPKSIMFYVAFVPHFIDGQAPYLPQAVILVLTSIVLGFCSDVTYALAASRAARLLRRPSTRRMVNRVTGGTLVGAGIAAAVART